MRSLLLAALVIGAVIVFVVIFRRGRKEPNSRSQDELTAKAVPVSSKSILLLQQQEIIHIPEALTPEHLQIPSPQTLSACETLDCVIALFVQIGFFPSSYQGQQFFVGPYGEVMFPWLCKEDNLMTVYYADDYNLALEHKFTVMEEFPLSLEEQLLPSVAEMLLDYAELTA